MSIQGNILIVDDDMSEVKMLTDALEQQGYKSIVGVTDPAEGVRLFGRKDFDLVLLDLVMPEMNGFEVIEEFRRVRGDHGVHIIMLTAVNDQEKKKTALKTGALEFMTKPYDVEELMIRVANCMNIVERHRRKCASYNLLAEELGEEKAELNQAKKNAIQLLGAAVAFRDNETGEHNLRIGTYSAILGKEMGISEKEIALIEQTAPLHDLGKVAIPDAILLKKGSLSLSERAKIEEHPVTGGEILSFGRSDLLVSARTIALTHHEKWDGTGYPQGRRGEDIPLAGRIVAVADVFDALVTRRPYKEPWTWNETMQFMEEERGGHFDPAVVDAFFSGMDQFKRILSQSRDPNLLNIKC